MAETALTLQQSVTTGLDQTPETIDQVNGNKYENDGRVILIITNTAESELDVTVKAQNACSSGIKHDVVVAIGADEERIMGPYPKKEFNTVDDEVLLAFETGFEGTISAIQT